MKADSLNFYKAWAPDNSDWTAWAKPVLFTEVLAKTPPKLNIPRAPEQSYIRTMVIVDLPGGQSVEEALAFAEKGCRPVPLYNGTISKSQMLVNTREIRNALLSGTRDLKALHLSPSSPPVFMLDSNRMQGATSPNYYDNRWCVFAQDMPSAAYIKSRGINKIIIRTNENIQPDLERILYDYQKSGIALYSLHSMTSLPKELTVRKRSFADEWAYRAKVILGLKRNATGGFGGKIPDPYEHRSSGGYYRYG